MIFVAMGLFFGPFFVSQINFDFREGTSAKKMLAFSLRDAREVNRFTTSQLKLRVVSLFTC